MHRWTSDYLVGVVPINEQLNTPVHIALEDTRILVYFKFTVSSIFFHRSSCSINFSVSLSPLDINWHNQCSESAERSLVQNPEAGWLKPTAG